jgi:Tfp pilus assembly protein PilX
MRTTCTTAGGHVQLPVKQNGTSLLIALLMLLILSIVGMGAIQNSGLQERIAGNTRDRNLAFNAAESALREAEDYLDADEIKPLFDGSTTGLYRYNDFPVTSTRLEAIENVDVTQSKLWGDPAMIKAIKQNGVTFGSANTLITSANRSTDIVGVGTQPKYIIEQMLPVDGRAITYRISALATGQATSLLTSASDGAVVVLQSYYTPLQRIASSSN